MRKFRDIVEDIKAPSTNDIWFNNGELKYYGPNGWTPFVQNKKDDNTEKSINQINKTLNSLIYQVNTNERTLNEVIPSAISIEYLKQAPKDLHIPVMSTAGTRNPDVDYAGTLEEWYQNNITVDADNKYNLKQVPMYLAIHHHLEANSTNSVGFLMGGYTMPVGWRINPYNKCIEFYEIYANTTLNITGKFDFKTGKYTTT